MLSTEQIQARIGDNWFKLSLKKHYIMGHKIGTSRKKKKANIMKAMNRKAKLLWSGLIMLENFLYTSNRSRD